MSNGNIVADLLNKLEADSREAFEERAAIMEFDAGLDRAHAEALAMLDVIRLHPLCVSGITTLQIELDGATEWLLTTDVDYARSYLATIYAKEIAVFSLADVLKEHYGGTALLTVLG